MLLVVGKYFLHGGPEFLGMILFSYMDEFMNQDIIENP